MYISPYSCWLSNIEDSPLHPHGRSSADIRPHRALFRQVFRAKLYRAASPIGPFGLRFLTHCHLAADTAQRGRGAFLLIDVPVALVLIATNITIQLPWFNVAAFLGILPIMLYCFSSAAG
jgi:hypothetical protein